LSEPGSGPTARGRRRKRATWYGGGQLSEKCGLSGLHLGRDWKK